MPRRHPPNPPRCSLISFFSVPRCQRPRLQQAGAQTHFIVNLLLYGWFITKGLPLSCPPLMRRARRPLPPKTLPPTPGGTICATATGFHGGQCAECLYRGSKGSAYAYCQFI